MTPITPKMVQSTLFRKDKNENKSIVPTKGEYSRIIAQTHGSHKMSHDKKDGSAHPPIKGVSREPLLDHPLSFSSGAVKEEKKEFPDDHRSACYNCGKLMTSNYGVVLQFIWGKRVTCRKCNYA